VLSITIKEKQSDRNSRVLFIKLLPNIFGNLSSLSKANDIKLSHS
jgi:hypothetical protein